MSDNKCTNCGQWSGKGHRCPPSACASSIQRIEAPSVSAGSRSTVADRVAVAQATLATVSRSPAQWMVIDDEYRDQRLDPLPNSAAHWAEIGPETKKSWSVTIRVWDDEADEPYDEASMVFPTEREAKDFAENYTPEADVDNLGYPNEAPGVRGVLSPANVDGYWAELNYESPQDGGRWNVTMFGVEHTEDGVFPESADGGYFDSYEDAKDWVLAWTPPPAAAPKPVDLNAPPF